MHDFPSVLGKTVMVESELIFEINQHPLIRDLLIEFQKTSKPLSALEFTRFWLSLSEDEQYRYLAEIL